LWKAEKCEWKKIASTCNVTNTNCLQGGRRKTKERQRKGRDNSLSQNKFKKQFYTVQFHTAGVIEFSCLAEHLYQF
jgi:hypothetical protein